MAFTDVFGGVPVADLPAALTWYERFFGRPPDLIPNDNEGAWQITGTGWIYVVGDADRAGNALLTLLVDELGEVVDGLTRRGLAAAAIDTMPGTVRKAAFIDPEGNRVTLAQPLADD